MSPLVSIIILNYNGKKFLKNCLESVFNNSFQDFEVIFVDNASTDGSVELVKELFIDKIQSGKLKIIVNEKNEGFCEGNNIGVRASSQYSKYICLLNNDTIVDKDWLKNLYISLISNPNVGLIGSNAKNIGYEYQHDIISSGDYVITCGPTTLGVFRKIDQTEKFNHNTIWQISCSGNGLMYNKSLIKEPFDADYFAYAEDWLLSLITMLKGYDCAMALDAKLIHLLSQTRKIDKKLDQKLRCIGHRNMLMTFFIVFEISTIFKLLPVMILYNILLILFNLKYFLPVIKIWWWLISNYKLLKIKRQNIQLYRSISDEKIINHMTYKLIEDDLPDFKYYHKIGIKMLNKILYIYCWFVRIHIYEFGGKEKLKNFN